MGKNGRESGDGCSAMTGMEERSVGCVPEAEVEEDGVHVGPRLQHVPVLQRLAGFSVWDNVNGFGDGVAIRLIGDLPNRHNTTPTTIMTAAHEARTYLVDHRGIGPVAQLLPQGPRAHHLVCVGVGVGADV